MTSSQTTVPVSSIVTNDDTPHTIVAADFDSVAYLVIEPGGANEEIVKVTNVSGSSFTGATRGLAFYGGTETSVTANQKTHQAGSTVIMTNAHYYYDKLMDLDTTETITGQKTFPSADGTRARVDSDTDTAVAVAFVTLGQLSRQAISGASNASTTVKGIVELATQSEADARTTSGATGALLVATPELNRAVLTHDYIADAGANDTYAITCVPAVTAYTAGDVYVFKANTANTGAATLNVNGLGAKNILKYKSLALDDNDIVANSVITVIYDGTSMQLQNPPAKQQVSQSGAEIFAADAGANDTYAITLSPVPAAYVTGMVIRFKANTANTGACTINVNSLGAKAIYRLRNGVLGDCITGDIIAAQYITLMYNGTQFEMQSTGAGAELGSAVGTITRVANAGDGSVSTAHGLGRVPKIVRMTAYAAVANVVDSQSTGFYNGTTTAMVYSAAQESGSGGIASGSSSVNMVRIYVTAPDSGGIENAVITVDATNINLAWTASGSPGATSIYIVYEVQ